MKRKILAITGSRAEYGLMRPVFNKIVDSVGLELNLIVTGMHLLPTFHDSLKEIEQDAFCPLHRVEMRMGERGGKSMAKSLGHAVVKMPGVISEVNPDIILLQGDRGEMLAGALAAAHMNIPIVHMSGGDRSGTLDDSIRNAISKFAHIHLSTCSQSTQGLLALGEKANRIFEVGEPGLDAIRTVQLLTRSDLAKSLGFELEACFALATLHPVTTEVDQAPWQMTELLSAIIDLGIQTVFTYPNTDAGGKEMTEVLESFRQHSNIKIVPHLGTQRYYSLMHEAKLMIGNSSSGILEAASFKLPVINVGTRQNARLRSNNVVDAGHTKSEIAAAARFVIDDATFRSNLEFCRNPYGDGHAAEKTVDILEKLSIRPVLLEKWLDEGKEDFLVNLDGVSSP